MAESRTKRKINIRAYAGAGGTLRTDNEENENQK